MWQRVKNVLRGYDRWSLVALGALLLVYAIVAVTMEKYVLFGLKDKLLVGIWLFMTAVMCWGIEPGRDLLRAAVGLGGGLVIEGWGTVTEVWWYFTDERPPLWILPAWPVAAIAIDRLARALELLLPPGRLKGLWFLLLPPFAAFFLSFALPFAWHPLSWLFLGGMFLVMLWPGDTRQDVALMLAGAGLGIFLEYWGTSRQCWTYYTREVPPVAAVLAHGFASVGFQRAIDIVGQAWSRWRAPSPVPAPALVQER